MNYQIEILIYWLTMCIVLLALFTIGSNILNSRLVCGKIKSYPANILKYLNISGWLGTIKTIVFLITMAVLSWGITFPTHFSVPTVRITAQGDIIPLPYGAWEWVPAKDSIITRLEPSIACDAILQGRTEDGIFIESPPFYHFAFQMENPETFYRHYKTNGRGKFCQEASEVILNKVFYGKTIVPDSAKNIASADKNPSALRDKLIPILAEVFADKGVSIIAN